MQRCQLWGVVNVTPDSFSDGGKFSTPELAIVQARRLQADGADVIDVGGASSRPRGKLYGAGAPPVSAEDERERVLPVVAALAGAGGRVSIDTTKPEVARAAIAAGASIVNDVSCGASLALLDVAAELNVEYVLMHTRGGGEVEPPNTVYGDVVDDVRDELLEAVARAEGRGITRNKLWIDPGIGFAKTAEQSAALLAAASVLVATGLRVLYGPSRKGFIAELAPLASGERPGPGEREAGTLAAVTALVLQGVAAVRVHDVAAARQAVLIAEAVAAHAGRRP
jgi:dihydropteroate synthase